MNVPDEIKNELDKRIKRLQALIEIAEERLPSSSDRPIPKPSSSAGVYLWMSTAWIVGGLLILYFLRSRYGGALGNAPTKVSLTVYTILTIGIVVLMVVYYLPKKRKEGEVFDLDDRARAARRVLREFYLPLKDALEKGDEKVLQELADKLIDDPLLAKSMEVLREGDPKLTAYALYLYLSRDTVERDEIREVIDNVDNKPMRLLLKSLLEG